MKRPFFYLALGVSATGLAAENFTFPPGTVADVTQPPYNAKADGVTNDTDAINRALRDKHPVVFLPRGTYVVSNTLRWGPGQAKQALVGENRDGTVIRLRDFSPGFSIAERPLALVWTGALGQPHPRNALRHLTLDTGRGNDGAIGVQFSTSEHGGLDDVLIRCGDKGPVGLDLSVAQNSGPATLLGVRVEGFDTGILTKTQRQNLAADSIELDGQKTAAWQNDGQLVSIRRLRTRGDAPAFVNGLRESVAVLDSATFTGSGEVAVKNANGAGIYARQLRAEGFKSLVENLGGHKQQPATLAVEEWASHPPLTTGDKAPAEPRGLGIAVEDAPRVVWPAPEQWAKVSDFPAEKIETTDKLGRKVRVLDSTTAFTAALGSGKAAVCFPKPGTELRGEVAISTGVQLIHGLEQPWGKSGGVWKIADGDAPLVIESFDWNDAPQTIRVTGSRPVVVRHTRGGSYEVERGARLFLEDVSATSVRVNGGRLWARGLRVEGTIDPKIVNDGGEAWLLGVKCDGETTFIATRGGGRTELFGGLFSAHTQKLKPPCFTVEGGALCGTFAEQVFRVKAYDTLLSGSAGEIKRGQTPERSTGSLGVFFSTEK